MIIHLESFKFLDNRSNKITGALEEEGLKSHPTPLVLPSPVLSYMYKKRNKIFFHWSPQRLVGGCQKKNCAPKVNPTKLNLAYSRSATYYAKPLLRQKCTLLS